MRVRLCSFVPLILSLLVIVPPVEAQQTIAVRGVVRDSSGGAASSAVVEAWVAGRRSAAAKSGADGAYQIDVPPTVPFELRVRLDGFAQQVIPLPGQSQPITRDIVLAVAGVSDTLVVTATRNAESGASITESVSSFSRQDIEALGSASLADIVRYVPAVNVETTGREGAVTSMFSRGGESDYNLVLIDGVRVNQSGGIFDFSRINAAEIDRVEVVRGAQSALWGSDAMGSVVQIFTRRGAAGDAAQLSGAIEGGSFGVMRGDARVHGGAGSGFDYHAGASRRKTNGAFDDLLPEDDHFSQNAVDAGAGAVLGSRGTIRGSVRYTKGKGRSVGQIAYGARDTGTTYETKDLSSHITFAHVLGPRLIGSATYNDFRYESLSADTITDPPVATYVVLTGTPNALFPNGTRLVRVIDQAEFNSIAAAGAMPAPGQFIASRQSPNFPFTSVTEFDRPAFRYQADYTFGLGRLTAGYEWERESSPADDTFRMNNNAGFVQQHVAIGDRWFATIGARVDSKDTYDTFLSPKLSAGGFLVPYRGGSVSSVKVFGNLGRGIKSPTFSERLGSPFTDPAPDLKVERARTGDAGVEATFADQRFMTRLVYFNNDYIDQIAFRSGITGDGIPEYLNIDGSKADGVELEWALQRAVGGFTASASYAYVDHKVVTNLSTSQQFQPGQPLLRRPKHAGSIRATFVRGRVALNADARVVGDRHDNSFLFLRTVPNAQLPTAITTDITVNPGYTVFGASVDVEAHDRLTVFARVANAGDEYYESVLGYPALPRSFIAGARFRLGGTR